MDTDKLQTRSGTKETLEGNRLVLREYARRVIVEKDRSLAMLQDLMGGLMRDYLRQGESLRLTQRDLVVLLYRGVLD